MYERLNHLNVCISYPAVLRAVEDISQRHTRTLQQWIREGYTFKFVGDNVDRRVTVREVRSDHHDTLHHMYILMALRSRVTTSSDSAVVLPDLARLPTSVYLPSSSDVLQLKKNLVIMVSHILCENIKEISCVAKLVPQHIYHQYSSSVCRKSEVVVLDVLHKNEISNADMLSIMKTQQRYLEDHNSTVLSGGDQLTCERQRCAKTYVMDGDTQEDRLDLLEPVVED